MVRSGSLALILALGAGCLTPLRADCPPWTVPVTGYGCYVDTSGDLQCHDDYTICVDIPWWTNPALSVQWKQSPAFKPKPTPPPEKAAKK